ncbi:hypothetical protein ACIQKB_17160 [Streptomyces sp. NPDC092046]
MGVRNGLPVTAALLSAALLSAALLSCRRLWRATAADGIRAE